MSLEKQDLQEAGKAMKTGWQKVAAFVEEHPKTTMVLVIVSWVLVAVIF